MPTRNHYQPYVGLQASPSNKSKPPLPSDRSTFHSLDDQAWITLDTRSLDHPLFFLGNSKDGKSIINLHINFSFLPQLNHLSLYAYGFSIVSFCLSLQSIVSLLTPSLYSLLYMYSPHQLFPDSLVSHHFCIKVSLSTIPPPPPLSHSCSLSTPQFSYVILYH